MICHLDLFVLNSDFYYVCHFSGVSQTSNAKRKIPTNSVVSKLSQTSPSLNTANKEDENDSIDENFWEKEAEKRRVDLEESLTENKELYEKIASLEEEYELSESLIKEAENLVEVLSDILKEDENENLAESDQTLHQSEEESSV